MKMHNRVLGLIILIFFTAGCGGYRVAGNSLPEVAADNHEDGERSALVKPGDRVRLNLVDGSQVEGMVALINPHEIVLNPEGQSVQPRGYSASQIQSIELGPPGLSMNKNTVGIVVGFLVICGLIIGVIAMSSMDVGIGN